MSKPLGTREGEGTKYRGNPSGPRCNKCERQLVKRKTKDGKYYDCPKHGFARDIIPQYKGAVK